MCKTELSYVFFFFCGSLLYNVSNLLPCSLNPEHTRSERVRPRARDLDPGPGPGTWMIKMRSVPQPHRGRPRRPSGPARSRRAGSGGGARRSRSTAASAAGSPAARPAPPPQTRPRPPSEGAQLCRGQEEEGGGFAEDPGFFFLFPLLQAPSGPAAVRCLHARERAQR